MNHKKQKSLLCFR